MNTIHKSAGIVIQNRRLLVVREFGEQIFHSPGGTLRKKEDPIRSLLREMNEETGIRFSSRQIEFFGKFSAVAANDPDKILELGVYMIRSWTGEIKPGKEIEEVAWVDSNNSNKLRLGSIFEHDVIPELKKRNLID